MKIIPESIKRNLGMKLLALTIAIVVYFAMREEVATLPLPTGVRNELPSELVIVTESPDGTSVRHSGRLVRDSDNHGSPRFRWLVDEDSSSSGTKSTNRQNTVDQPKTQDQTLPPTTTSKGLTHAVQADR